MSEQYEEGFFPAPLPESDSDQQRPEGIPLESGRMPLADLRVRPTPSAPGTTDDEIIREVAEPIGPQRLKKGMVLNGHRLESPIGGGKSVDTWQAAHPTHGITFLKVIDNATFPSNEVKRADPEAFASIEKVFVEFEMLHQTVMTDLTTRRPGDGALVTPLDMGRTAEGKIFKTTKFLAREFFDGVTGKSKKSSRESLEPAVAPTSKSLRANRWTAPQKTRFLRSALLGLWQLHRLGYVHGDIKPQNLLAVNSPDGYLARIIDFDNCYPSGAPLDASLIGGDETYFSPERADYQNGDLEDPSVLTTSSDLFSLSLVLHEIFSDKQELPTWSPSFGGSASDACRAGSTPSYLSLGTADKYLEELLKRCLRRDPGSRPSTYDLLVASGVYLEKTER
jgi:serine/threonine protein kinase